MTLLERERELTLLNERLSETRTGRGSVVLVSGEAGIGKSALVRSLASMLRHGEQLLIGTCDPISTPAPHAPLHDLAPALGEEVVSHLRDRSSSAELFSSVLTALRAKPGTVLVVEDVHWADEGTLDLLRYLSRRVEALPVLLAITTRSDEIDRQARLRRFLGDLARVPGYRRLALEPLSADAVQALIGARPISATALYQRTGGNPFFVTELLDSESDLPVSVFDAILGRLSRLESNVQKVVHIAAVIGPGRTAELISAVAGRDCSAELDVAIQAGLLTQRSGGIEFRHELARDATLEAITPLRRRELHRAILRALPEVVPNPNPAWLAHYAIGAGDAAAIRTHSTAAARRAAELGACREAAHHYQHALAAADDQPEEVRIPLLEGYARATIINGWANEDIRTRTELIEHYRARGERRAVVGHLRLLATSNFNAGRNAAGNAAIQEALALLDQLPEDELHAQVFATNAMVLMLDRKNAEAIEWGHRASKLATHHADLDTILRAQNAIGSAMIVSGNLENGRSTLERAIASALAHGRTDLAVNLRSNLGSAAGEIYELEAAEPALLTSIEKARARDFDGALSYAMAWLALVRLSQGRWDESARLATDTLAMPHAQTISHIMANAALGRVRARRGDPGIWEPLDEALRLAEPTGTLQRMAPVAAARAEARWLEGDREGTVTEALRGYELAVRHDHRWYAGELSYWLRQAGTEPDVPFEPVDPLRYETASDGEVAVRIWDERGCRYEAARARFDEGTSESLLLALSEFEALGARPMALRTTQRLRELGVASIPRGPRRETRANPAGLTARELEVLGLLQRGATNNEIGAMLFVSPRTVEHHVSSILDKLDTSSRREAVDIAIARGILSA